MPRPVKCRKVCSLPKTNEFVPVGEFNEDETVILTVDEYECIRLIDYEGFSQEECSTYMCIARSTVQMIYISARKKLATALVNSNRLKICGGRYRLCDGKEKYCNCGGCQRHRQNRFQNKGE